MLNFTDDKFLETIKLFCHYLFETVDIEKALALCSDDIHYYNSLGTVDIVGKENLFVFFLERQAELNSKNEVIYHRYTLQRINAEHAIVHLMAEIKDKFWVNSSITLKTVEDKILICNINGFFSAIKQQVDVAFSTQHKILKSFFKQFDDWKENKKNLLSKKIINVSQKNVMDSFQIGQENCQDADKIALSDFLDGILQRAATEESKKEIAKVYQPENLLEKFHNSENNFQILFPFEHKDIIHWCKSYNTLYQHPLSKDILCFIISYDVTEELIKNYYSDFYFYSQIDFFAQLNIKNDSYSFFPCSMSKNVADSLNITGKFSVDFEHNFKKYLYEEQSEKIREEFNYENILKHIEENDFHSFIIKAKRDGNPKDIVYKQIQFFKFCRLPYLVNIVCSDVTEVYAEEMKNTEILTEALEVAKNANFAKNTFLASMSHDLRTPINAILGMTQLAMEDLSNREQVYDSFSVIKESTEHLLNLVNDLLEVNRIESGNLEVKKETFSVTEQTEKIISFYHKAVLEKNQQVMFDCSQVEHKTVLGDKNKFTRILSNIIGNAVKYTMNNGRIWVTVQETKNKAYNISYYKFIVKDTGIGIDPKNIPFIFDPFHREENGKVRKIEGLGLGLSIVRAFVESLGGTVFVESVLGEGSAFTVELPYSIEQNGKTEDKEKEISTKDIPLTGFSVLLAEDNIINIHMFKKILEKCGAKVSVVQNGLQAYQAVLQMQITEPFDIVFMDMQMPVMSGLEATRKIRSLSVELAKKIPIVAVSAGAFQEDIQKCLDAGMNTHIAKPIKLYDLKQVLQELNIIP